MCQQKDCDSVSLATLSFPSHLKGGREEIVLSNSVTFRGESMTALFWHHGIDDTKARDSCLLYWKRTLEFIRSPIKDYELNFAFKVIQ